MAAALLILSLEACGARAVPLETPPDRLNVELQKNRKELAKTTNPISRVKILIKISDALLRKVAHAASAGEIDSMKSNLTEYTSAIEDSQKTLRESGRNARAKSDGFLDLEIAMRRQLREMEDIRATLTSDEREPVTMAIARTNAIRNSILEALMGNGNATR